MKTHAEIALLCLRAYPGIAEARQLSALGGVVYVWDDGPITYVVFRGTDDALDVLVDLDAVMTNHFWGKVHAGFSLVWSQLKAEVRKHTFARRLVIAGHSYGGALATLAAAEFHDQVKAVVTFGCPRVGDAQFADNWQRANLHMKTTRYVNQLDPIPMLPPWLWGFRHVGRSCWFDGARWRMGVSWLVWLKRFFRPRRWMLADHSMHVYNRIISEVNPCGYHTSSPLT